MGRSARSLLSDAGLTTVVNDLNIDTVSQLISQGLPAIFGDASKGAIREQAGVSRASQLVVTFPDASTRRAVVSRVTFPGSLPIQLTVRE